MLLDDHDDAVEILYEGPASVVTRIESDSESSNGARFIAVKTSTTVHANEPHDIVKEVRLLASLSHPNIVPLIKHEACPRSQDLSLWMPYMPYSLDNLLQSSRFSPHPIISLGSTNSSSPTPREIQFVVLAKSTIFQVLCGVSYLHGEHVQIAHRDVKPSNVLLTPSGCARLIDFGIAFRVDEEDTAKARDLWPESVTRMYFEVSTGPYRAPELLFGPRTYAALAIDAWSLGATIAEFFTSLRLETDEDDEDLFQRSDRESESGSDSSTGQRASTPPPTPFVIPRGTHLRPTGRWKRTTLFDGSRGEIGLAWSIFKIRGTPNADTWPSFVTLPDAGKLTFVDVAATDLAAHLPNLPPSAAHLCTNATTHAPSPDPVASPLDLVHRFLVYEPLRRLGPAAALDHPWFRAEPGLVLPADWESGWVGCPRWVSETGAAARSFALDGQTRTLGDLLRMYVTTREH